MHLIVAQIFGKIRNFVNPDKQLLEFTTIVNKGEAISIALQNGWGKSKVQKLTNLLHEIAIIDISDDKIIEAYAVIDAFSQNSQISLSINKKETSSSLQCTC